MIRVERKEGERGVLLDGRALEDSRLSFRAKGLLAYLYALPGRSLPDVKNLEGVSTEKRSAIRTALDELIERGYVNQIDRAEPEEAPRERGQLPLMEALFSGMPEEGEATEHGEGRSAPPKAPPKKGGPAEEVKRVIDHLNLLRERSWDWAQYTPLSATYAKNVEHIGGRLRDGYTEADLILVLDYLAAVDGGKEESRRYFNCVTPFNTKNFERNIALARDWAARGRRTKGRKHPGTNRGKEYYLGKGEQSR